MEVFKRRQPRSREDLRPKLRRRLIQAMLASGLTPQAYEELVRSRDEAANALLDEALAAWREEQARDQALAQAFQASGLTLAEFADTYGLKPGEVKARLARVLPT
jgi:deoxyribodipyrimidine photolyase